MGDTKDRVGAAGVIVAGGFFKIALYVCVAVWERHGIPLCPQPLDEAAWQCVHEAFADGLFLCGKNAQESLSMARQVRQRVPGITMFQGGGATKDNVRELLKEYDAVFVAK